MSINWVSVGILQLLKRKDGQKETRQKETEQKETRQKETGQKVLLVGQKVFILKFFCLWT